MTSKSQQPTGRSGLLSSLNVAIEVMNAAEEIVSVTSAKAVFSSVCVLLTMIRVRFIFLFYMAMSFRLTFLGNGDE